MSKDNFITCLKHTLKWEGGYSDHPSDPGGATNYGVTHIRYNQYRQWKGLSKRPVSQITRTEMEDIYRHYYWDVVKGDDLPLGLDLAVFDYAVNSGPRRAVKHLQGILGVNIDGLLGPDTIKAIHKSNVSTLIKALCDRRLRFVKGLRIYKTFGRGWGRRIKGIRKTGLSMFETVPVFTNGPSIIKRILWWLHRYL